MIFKVILFVFSVWGCFKSKPLTPKNQKKLQTFSTTPKSATHKIKQKKSNKDAEFHSLVSTCFAWNSFGSTFEIKENF
jgi:hypothetical protein